MSTPPPNSQSLRRFSPITLPTWTSQVAVAIDVDSKVDEEVDQSSFPGPAVTNRGVGSRSTRQQRLSFSSLAPSSTKPFQENQKGIGDTAAQEVKPLPPQRPLREEALVVNGKEEEQEEEEEEEEVKRSWNLRPRRSCVGSKRNHGGFSLETCGGTSEAKNQKPGGVMEPKSNRQRRLPAESPGLGGGEGRNENLRLWIALSRDEIEEDIFSMSGNRPSRRPRKRPKALQKNLDIMFPGLCLVGLNADCFRTINAQPKGR